MPFVIVSRDFPIAKLGITPEIPQFYGMKWAKWRSKLVLILLVGTPGLAAAKVSLPAFFSDHMVLQGGAFAPVWGRAAPGEQVIVSGSWDGASLLTYADGRGRWRVDLATPPPGGPYQLRIEGPENTLLIRDVLVGEVWLATGDTGAGLPAAGEAGTLPQVRFFRIQPDLALSPRFDLKGEWVVCSPAQARQFSALAYHFARHMHDSLGIPIGLIEASYPQAPVQAWISRPSLEAEPAFAHLLTAYDAELRAQRAGIEGDRTALYPYHPTVLFNAMVAPLIPLAIQGHLWLPGTANATDPFTYRQLLPALVLDWRRQWGWRFACYLVQPLPGPLDPPGAGAGLREAQLPLLHLPNTGLVGTLDLKPGASARIAERLARWALAHHHDRDYLLASGPLAGAPLRRGAALGIPFAHAPGGLEIRPGTARLSLAGDNRQWFPAEVRLAGDTLWLSHPEVPAPVAARYAFADTATATLFNQAGLPALPFRTDDWPLFFRPPQLEAAYDRGEDAFILTVTYRHPQDPQLHYRLDGQAPDRSSPRYTGPLRVEGPAQVRVRAYAGGIADPQVAALDLRRHRALRASLLDLDGSPDGPQPPLTRHLLDGLLGSADPFDGRWFALKGRDLTFTLDLGEKMTLDSAGLRCLWAPSQGHLLPREVSLATSTNGRRFREAGLHRPATAGPAGPYPISFGLDGRKARYLRFSLQNAGPLPAGHPEAGAPSWLALDEVWVE